MPVAGKDIILSFGTIDREEFQRIIMGIDGAHRESEIADTQTGLFRE